MKLFTMTLILLGSLAASAQTACAILSTSHVNGQGSRLVIPANTSYADLGEIRGLDGRHFDNRVVKLQIVRGCSLISYQYQNFNVDYSTGQSLAGFTLLTESQPAVSENLQTVYLDSYYQNKISSVKCFCQ